MQRKQENTVRGRGKKQMKRERLSQNYKDTEGEKVRLTLLLRFESSPDYSRCALPQCSEGPSQPTPSIYRRHIQAWPHTQTLFWHIAHTDWPVDTHTRPKCLLGFVHHMNDNATLMLIYSWLIFPQSDILLLFQQWQTSKKIWCVWKTLKKCWKGEFYPNTAVLWSPWQPSLCLMLYETTFKQQWSWTDAVDQDNHASFICSCVLCFQKRVDCVGSFQCVDFSLAWLSTAACSCSESCAAAWHKA